MIKKIFAALGSGILAVVMILVATITTFAVPTIAVLWLSHSGPFAGPSQPASTTAFCSTLNEMTAYATSHPTPSTPSEFQSSITYSHRKLTGLKQVPKDISGTVSASLVTSGAVLDLIQLGVADNGWTTVERQRAETLIGVFDREASTLNHWYQSNC